jgi:hypothetical protein
LAGLGWELGSSLGRLAVLVFCLVLLIVLLSGSFHVGEKISRILPEPVVRFFAPTGPQSNEPSRFEKARARILTELGLNAPRKLPAPSSRPASFHVGSSKEEVRAIQGSPSRSLPDVWYYGDSEVFFASDRVVGWRSSSSNPLRAN